MTEPQDDVSWASRPLREPGEPDDTLIIFTVYCEGAELRDERVAGAAKKRRPRTHEEHHIVTFHRSRRFSDDGKTPGWSPTHTMVREDEWFQTWAGFIVADHGRFDLKCHHRGCKQNFQVNQYGPYGLYAIMDRSIESQPPSTFYREPLWSLRRKQLELKELHRERRRHNELERLHRQRLELERRRRHAEG